MSTKNKHDLILSGDASAIVDLANAITQISDAYAKMLNGPLTKRALILLIKDSAEQTMTMAQIEAVLDAVSQLKVNYLKDEHINDAG